jgi:hypothetical protein
LLNLALHRTDHEGAIGANAGRHIVSFSESHFKLMLKRIKKLSPLSPSNLIAAAMALHLILTISVYVGGRLKLSQIIDENGLVVTIAHDSRFDYLPQASSLAETLTQQGIVAWLNAPVDLHVKLYALTFAVLGPWLGANILSAEPISVLCYVAILSLTFKLGEEVFERRVGFISAGAVALWPSFLLHTTQLLKDPLFIAALLMLLLISTRWLTRILSLAQGLKTGIIGGSAAYVISLTRSGFWLPIVLAIALIGVGLALLRQIREKRVLAGNVVSAALVLSIVSIILLSAQETFQAAPTSVETSSAGNDPLEGKSTNPNEPTAEWKLSTQHQPVSLSLKARADLGAVRLSQLRHEFIRLNMDAGSNMDGGVEFTSAGDVLRYLPRAMMIGFFAPFPNQWLASGVRVGRAGRLISGLEMSAIYGIEFLALVGLWRARSSLPAWLLFCVSVVGIMALALVVINVGALYRMRYAFIIPLCILGAGGLMQILLPKSKESAVAGGEAIVIPNL